MSIEATAESGVIGIRLLPTWDAPVVVPELAGSIRRAARLQAAVAFWTIGNGPFGTPLVDLLKRTGSFLCTDVHLPTDIDALAALATPGANIRVYAQEIPSYTASGRKEPPALLHAKMLLFSTDDGNAELWVGSHNWTNRALYGLNIEASLVLTLRPDSPLLAQASQYLERIHAISEAFDPANVEFYKQLQRPSPLDIVHVVELEADDGEALSEEVITVFGTDTEDLDDLGTVGRHLYASVIDPTVKHEHLYPATILHSGVLAANDPLAGGVTFSPRRHAFRRGRTRPIVLPRGPVDPQILAEASYFATLHLAHINPTVVAERVPRHASAWEPRIDERARAILDRLPAEARTILFRGRTPRVKRPMPPADRDNAGLKDVDAGDRGIVVRRILRAWRA